MALQKGKLSEIPADAVRLSKYEAIEYQLKQMHDWPNWKDTFFFKHGTGVLGGASAAIGIYLNSHYRKKLKLYKYGQLSSFFANALIPAGLCMVFHRAFVVPQIVLQESCAVCTEIRAASIQAFAGCVLPSILAPLAGFSNALNYGTYSIPYVNEPMKIINLWRKLTKPIGNTLFALFLAQALLASGITMLEWRNLDIVRQKTELKYMRDTHY